MWACVNKKRETEKEATVILCQDRGEEFHGCASRSLYRPC